MPPRSRGARADLSRRTASFALARARDWASFRDALRSWRNAPFNVVYADVDGHIGYQLAGRIPAARGRGAA